ncbi:Vacuolar protein-sorting-associated protein 36, partial [Linderina pennispora]
MEQVELAPTLRPLLESNEKIISVQNKVGLYKGAERDEEHDNGTVYLTTHRIVYVDQARPHERSAALDLARVKRSSVHSGFIYSSGKVHLHIAPARDSGLRALDGSRRGSEPTQPATSQSRTEWQCPICDNMNVGALDKCSLCGVPYEEPAQKAELQLTCSVCTFHNHISMARCEMCETELTRPVPPTPGERAVRDDSDDEDASELLKLSFRAGGSSSFHSALKDVLNDKAWLEPAEAASPAQPMFPGDRRPTVGGISTL